MNLNDLLRAQAIDPEHVLVLRHRPKEPELQRKLPWLAAERPEIFNAYQRSQGGRLEGAMHGLEGSGYVASFIGCEPGSALFVGLYGIRSSKPLKVKQFWQIPAHHELKSMGAKGWATEEIGKPILWFDLELLTSFYPEWKGKLVIGWSRPERVWARRAHTNNFPVLAIHNESQLVDREPAWDTIDFSWSDLSTIPTSWKTALRQWRGVYYIFDTSDGKGYVGSAYGRDNILGRWLGYAATGHGGNKLLRKRDPQNFRFSILQLLAHDELADRVIHIENTWKDRLHTRAPLGLNDN